ncbi:hypothetical protein ACFFMN_20710 [Planobispora siamensis]|uniref:Uncharacterized protein n=1 Tax=Planobispora siamensis TaxID=936338 RepID=A0A8J3WN69_9ACTN|nr:hypothetical protein [Planobispora siamensis]GIH93556.1 hypothetical protein Psi01_41860 [Planobispora siamensis]
MVRVFMSVAFLIAVLLAGTAAPANARASGCEVVVISVTANDVQEDDEGFDDIWVKVAGSWFPTYLRSIRIDEGRTLTNSELNNPKATKPSVTVSIYEDDPFPQGNDFLGSFSEDCSDGGTGPGGAVQTIGSGGVGYTVSYFARRV